MKKHFLDGHWRGQYTYGDGYDIQQVGISVNFEINIKFDGDVFTGTFVDDETKHLFNEPGTVQGIFHDNYISMIKKYPCFVSADENNNTIAVPGQESLQIHYTGTLRKKGLSFYHFFEGEWEITALATDEEGNDVYITGTGEWTMQR